MTSYLALTAALLASTGAYAQTTATAQPGAEVAPAGDTQPSAPAAGPDVLNNDIVVTAQRREQTLQNVSASISAVSSDRIANAHINQLQDLQVIVPSVSFGNDFNQAKVFIRGVGANTSTTGNSTGVALHVDGAYVARAEAQLTSLFDLERVEVLRGPQGTLYGRNAVGGSINLITAKPTRELSGYARLTYGNYNQIVSEAAISGPITDNILFRIAAKTEDHDGFGKNPVSGADVDDLNRRMIRGQLQFGTGTTRLLLEGEYFRQNDSSGAVHYLQASFPGVARLAPLGVGGYATKPRDLATESQPGTDSNTYSFTGTFTSELSDTLSVTNIANYRRFKSSLYQDLDLSAVVNSLPTNGQPTTVQERRIDSEQYSNELQFNYKVEHFNAVVGAFYFHERQRPIDNVGLSRRNGLASNIAKYTAAGVPLDYAYYLCGYTPDVSGGSTVIAPKRVCTHSNLGDDSAAVFGQGNLDLGAFAENLSTITLKFGGRYSYEKVTSENPSIVITGGGAGSVIYYTAAATHRERSFNNFSPEAGIEWKPSRDILVYYNFSRGFKAGSGENASGSTTIVGPEKIENHEIGIKTNLFDRRLSVNLAGYTYTLDGAQYNKTIAGGPTGYTTIFQNAATTSAKGVELEIFGRPAQGVRVSGALSYTRAKYDNYLTLDPLNPANIAGGAPYNAVTNPSPTAFGAPGGGNIQLAGNQVRNTPKWAWNLHGEYDLPIDVAGGRLTVQGDVSHKSRIYFSEFQRNLESSAGYTMVDAVLNFRAADTRITAQLWVKNAFNLLRPASTFALATGRLIGATYLPPRTFGATVGYKF